MTALLGDERPDIVAAAALMGWRMGGKRELKELAGHLYSGETVRFIAQGTYENDQSILVLIDVRLLFLFHGVMRQAKEDFREAVRRRPPIPLIGPAWERRTLADDLFHEPEAQPETVATGVPPKATVSDRHPPPGDTSSDTSQNGRGSGSYTRIPL